MENNIIDDLSELDRKDRPYHESLIWWEKRRLRFNIIVGLSGLLATLIFAGRFSLFELFGSIMWGVMANILYSVGFLLEALDFYYFKGSINIKYIRPFLFFVGTFLYASVSYIYASLFFSPNIF